MDGWMRDQEGGKSFASGFVIKYEGRCKFKKRLLDEPTLTSLPEIVGTTCNVSPFSAGPCGGSLIWRSKHGTILPSLTIEHCIQVSFNNTVETAFLFRARRLFLTFLNQEAREC